MQTGTRVLGIGIIGLAMVSLVWGDFDFGQPVPKDFPARNLLAYAAASFMLVAGAGLEWRRTVKWSAAALAIYFGLVVSCGMNLRVIVANYKEYGAYSGVAAPVAVAAAALIVYAANIRDAGSSARWTRAAQIAFGVCAILFGGAHFVYMNLTAPLVPKWLPPSQEFWGYATGAAHIAAGIAFISKFQARLAAILLTIMYASFTPLVHIPALLSDPHSRFNWSENAWNIMLAAGAWTVAESLLRRKSRETEEIEITIAGKAGAKPLAPSSM